MTTLKELDLGNSRRLPVSFDRVLADGSFLLDIFSPPGSPLGTGAL